MQGDYVADLLIFLLSLVFITFYMYLYAPVDSSQEVRLDVQDNRLQILEENSGLTYLRTSPQGYENNSFMLLSEYYSLSEGESYFNDKSALMNDIESHKNNLLSSQESSYIEYIWIPEISEEGEKQGTPFPVPSSKGVKEVWLKVA